MGAYSEYLGRPWTAESLTAERKVQLKRISKLRNGRDLLVIAADLTKGGNNISISLDYSDILPVQDQLSVLHGSELDLILETPGGLAEVAEDIVRQIRTKYARVGVIVPGWAKSAGTILAMAGDEILMGASSALGPIDPQIGFSSGKRFSADAFLEGLDKIKDEVQTTGKLNAAYIPILQNISPGEIQNSINARKFSQELVREWLVQYKFKFWVKHAKTGKDVTDEEKTEQAAKIAEALCNHSKWLTHNRSLRREDLEGLGLKITDYTLETELNDAITRYYTLLKMTFDMVNVYKMFETADSQVMRMLAIINVAPQVKQAPAAAAANVAHADYKCGKCAHITKFQLNLGTHSPVQPGYHPYPVATNVFKCPRCGTDNNLMPLRLQVEAQSGKKLVA